MAKKHHRNQQCQAQQNLYEAFATLTTLEEVQQFLEDLCTPNELQTMADRWKVVGLLKSGQSYREIAISTGISVTTIGRVARYLEYGKGGYHSIFQRIQEIKQLKEKIES